jgi:hypothetical protein
MHNLATRQYLFLLSDQLLFIRHKGFNDKCEKLIAQKACGTYSRGYQRDVNENSPRPCNRHLAVTHGKYDAMIRVSAQGWRCVYKSPQRRATDLPRRRCIARRQGNDGVGRKCQQLHSHPQSDQSELIRGLLL